MHISDLIKRILVQVMSDADDKEAQTKKAECYRLSYKTMCESNVGHFFSLCYVIYLCCYRKKVWLSSRSYYGR